MPMARPDGTAPPLSGVYRRRHPQNTSLFKCISENLETFIGNDEDRFLERLGFLSDRAVDTFRAFLRGGILR